VNNTKWQKRFNIALIALGIWLVLSVITRVFTVDYLTTVDGPGDPLVISVMKYLAMLDAFSAVLSFVTAAVRYRNVAIAPQITLVVSAFFVIQPIFLTPVGIFGLVVIRKEDRLATTEPSEPGVQDTA
jgi:hypothetical membrane protein